ncbi:MAG: ribosome silencing factor [Tepidisphaeraceae bacterium]
MTWTRRCSIATRKSAARTKTSTQSARSDATKRFAIEAARLAANTRCQHVLVLDVRGLSPVTDYFVIASGTSPRQMQSVADDIAEFAGPLGHKLISHSGYGGENWILLDFVNVIVHLFSPESRLFYDIENLWGDARRIEWNDQPA